MLRFLLSKLSPPTTPAQRLAVAFAVSERDAERVLDRVGGDECRAEVFLLYAAKWHRGIDGALEDFSEYIGPERFAEALTFWEGTIEGRTAVLSWQAAQIAGPFRLRLTVKFMRDSSRAWARDFEKNFATARAALRRETGR